MHKLARFARSVVVVLSTFKQLNELGISFLSLSKQGMDFTTPMGKVMFGMLALLAEYYSESLGVDGGVAEVNRVTKDGALLAFRLASEGQSCRKVAQALNAAGYRTAGNMRRGVFTNDTVRDMLANRFYLGELPVFEPGTSRRVRGWQPAQHSALIESTTFEAARQAITGRASSAKADRRNASIYSLSGPLRCVHCSERMRVLHNNKGRIRYYCRNRAQGLGCSGRGSFLDTYEEQLVGDLAAFALPDDWKQHLLVAATDYEPVSNQATQRTQLQARLERLRELYSWGDLTREAYQGERDRIERSLAALSPETPVEQHLDRLAAYVESLPSAWADASQEQRNQLATIIYEEVWVDGPVVEHVKPRPELEPVFQARTGAAQPTTFPSDTDCQAEKWQRRPRRESVTTPAIISIGSSPRCMRLRSRLAA